MTVIAHHNIMCNSNRCSLPASAEAALAFTETDVVIPKVHVTNFKTIQTSNIHSAKVWSSMVLYTDDGIRRVPSNAEDFDDRPLWGRKISMYARCGVHHCLRY